MRRGFSFLAISSIALLTLIYGPAGVNAQAQQVQPKAPEISTSKGGLAPDPDSALRVIRPPFEPAPIPTESDPTMTHEIFEDFVNGGSYTALEKINQLASAGGGSGQGWYGSSVYEDAWGVIEAHHGTGTYSRLDLVGKTNNMHGVAVGIGTSYEYQTRFNFANLSNETNRYITFDGFFDSDTVDPTFNRGILFRYSDDINEGRFQVVVREAAGAETLVDTGVQAEANVWYRVKISVNASGDEAQFFINGVSVAIVRTNLAVGTNNRYTAESNTDRQSGTTNFVSRRFDYVRFRAVAGRASRL